MNWMNIINMITSSEAPLLAACILAAWFAAKSHGWKKAYEAEKRRNEKLEILLRERQARDEVDARRMLGFDHPPPTLRRDDRG